MKKVLFISISKDAQTSVEEAMGYSPHRGLLLETTASFGQDASWWASSGPDTLCLILPLDEQLQNFFLTKLKEVVPKDLPILLLSPIISPPLMQLSQIFSRVRMVKMPALGPSLLKALNELTTDYAPEKRQMHPRYLTDQEIHVTTPNGALIMAKMKNLSLSGAYFETPTSDEPMSSGALMRIEVQMGTPPKEYEFDAKVVWRKSLEGDSSGFGYGVTFVDKDEVYNHLLKGF